MNVNFLPENTSLITRKRDIVEGIPLHPKRMSNPTSILSGPNSSNVKSTTYLKPNLKIGNSISQNFDSFIRKGENYCLCSFPETSNYRDSLLKSLNDGNLDPSIIHKMLSNQIMLFMEAQMVFEYNMFCNMLLRRCSRTKINFGCPLYNNLSKHPQIDYFSL